MLHYKIEFFLDLRGGVGYKGEGAWTRFVLVRPERPQGSKEVRSREHVDALEVEDDNSRGIAMPREPGEMELPLNSPLEQGIFGYLEQGNPSHDLIDLRENLSTMSTMEVKAQEAAAMDRLESALDLGAAPDRVLVVARSATASLAGAADFSVLATASLGGQNTLFAEASDPLAWLRDRQERSSALYARVVTIPGSPAGRVPGTPFLLFQDETSDRLRRQGMPRQLAPKILAAFAEMADNAIDHSLSTVQPLATFEVDHRWWEFSVTDFGCGVPNSLRTNPKYRSLSDLEAVREAFIDGVSRYSDECRGFGFGVLLRALAEHECVIRMRTGDIVARWTGKGVGVTGLNYQLVSSRPGLHIRVSGSL